MISRQQIFDLRLTSGFIEGRVRSHRLAPIYPGVYSVSFGLLPKKAYWMAATLSRGRGAMLSHRSAAALWGLVRDPGPIEILRSSSSGKSASLRIAGGTGAPPIAARRSRHLEESEFTILEGIRLTTVPRTLLDLAAVLSLGQIESAINQAEQLRLLAIRDVQRQMSRGSGWKGIENLRLAIRRWDPSKLETKSELELRFLGLCQDSGIPLPEVNVLVEGIWVDCFWSASKLIVELDGYAYHSNLSQFHEDRRRTIDLENKGFRVLRLTYEMVTDDADETATSIKSRLSGASGLNIHPT